MGIALHVQSKLYVLPLAAMAAFVCAAMVNACDSKPSGDSAHTQPRPALLQDARPEILPLLERGLDLSLEVTARWPTHWRDMQPGCRHVLGMLLALAQSGPVGLLQRVASSPLLQKLLEVSCCCCMRSILGHACVDACQQACSCSC
jgi:hypothetical protein